MQSMTIPLDSSKRVSNSPETKKHFFQGPSTHNTLTSFFLPVPKTPFPLPLKTIQAPLPSDVCTRPLPWRSRRFASGSSEAPSAARPKSPPSVSRSLPPFPNADAEKRRALRKSKKTDANDRCGIICRLTHVFLAMFDMMVFDELLMSVWWFLMVLVMVFDGSLVFPWFFNVSLPIRRPTAWGIVELLRASAGT